MGTCFPNCHPVGQHMSAFQASGKVALGLAIVCIVILAVMTIRGK